MLCVCLCLCLCVCVGGCVDAPGVPAALEAPQVELSPLLDGRALPVVRIRIQPTPLGLRPPAIFAGVLSDYQLRRFAEADPPESLLAREVPTLGWREVLGDSAVLAPSELLKAGHTYSLVAPGFGLLKQFEVASLEDIALLRRLWPPPASDGGGSVVLCGQGSDELPATLEFEPIQRFAELSPVGFAWQSGESCVEAEFDASDLDGFTVVLPAFLNQVLLDPEPLRIARAAPLARARCEQGEVEFGPGCLRVEDDRVNVRNGDQALLWRLEWQGALWNEPLRPGANWLLRGLEPEREYWLAGSVVTLSGERQAFQERITTESARTRLLIHEVLANPLGAEPASEWVELLNDGAESIELSGVRLEDSAASIELPSLLLAPGEFVLVTRSDFVAGGYDVPVAPGVRLLRVPELGKSGLSNSGEPLLLRAADGQILSRFPPIAARHAGTSVARRAPEVADDELGGFGEHATPGASPGAPNALGP